MKDQAVYYCWFCDAHRVPAGQSSSPSCPRCGQALPAEARLATLVQIAPRELKPVRSAARFAAQR
jgi:hypothetical protein